ncbi:MULTISPECIES: sulfatase-like hydrolase/transferase [Bifidobacterium]|uniref:Sulfatase-like hydrolase/transferase n=1 Tax=Bifidobacterium apousia TaxID=2750996 RepID=A0A556R687_9BIFI|nr:sulfatase-like hydrolase/transferase [Bifidobacterium apousia]MBI0136932.1 sulfatase-like hydrolase/transferase [Bifidobacterium sp. W8120]TSJ84391.1 sulfatase-like hydrolase/transferase [Bifidobacterium apousia]
MKDRKRQPGRWTSWMQNMTGRLRVRGWVYLLAFILIDFLSVGILQWGVSLNSSRVELSNPLIGFWGFISAIWTQRRFVLVLNMLAVGLVYLALTYLTNRFWAASGLILAICAVIAVIERFKVRARYEAILPSDLDFLHADAANLVSFLPARSLIMIGLGVVALIVLGALCWVLTRMDARRGRPVATGNKPLGAGLRTAGVLVPVLVVAVFMSTVGTYGSPAYRFSQFMGDIPSMWDSVYDAQRNGVFVSFSRQLRPKVMDQPAGYSRATMQSLAHRYQLSADRINHDRKAYMNESSLVYILSESFSDPTRVPGVALNQDPMPHIRSIKGGTTSGLMLSSGYGGGTANLEFQAMTGLSMANFDPSLTSPYQQVIPHLNWIPTVNQAWGTPSRSLAFHPYESSMYSRAENYKKFGFSHFYSLTGPDQIAHQDRIDRSQYVGDRSAYESALEQMGDDRGNQFVEVITMQNHMPYNDWYDNNGFSVSSSDPNRPLGDDEMQSIRTYAKGVSLSDQATADFLNSLDSQSKPVTVVFYGDHLPGIYGTASWDERNSLALHLTDYFIWSNKASDASGAQVSNSAYSSPNFFQAQAAEHMDAKVSPFTAFLTELHEKISAIEPPVANQIQDWNRIPAGQTNYLNAQGQPMNARDFDKATRQLLNDYKLIQYDIMAGKHYLQGTGFTATPTRRSDAARQKAEKKRQAKEQAKEQVRQEEQNRDKDRESSTSSAN